MTHQNFRFVTWLFALCIIPNIATGQRPTLTALEAVTRTDPVAKQWTADAKLIFVGTAIEPGMYANGKADAWACGYYSAAKDSARNYYAASIGPVSYEPTPPTGYPSLQPVGANWRDSDAAGQSAERRGGARFRAAHPDAIVAAALSYGVPWLKGEWELRWWFVYASPKDSTLIMFELSAGTLVPPPQWIVTTYQPPLGQDIPFTTESGARLAVLNFSSGKLDSVRLEVFPELLPDTAGTNKAVLRYFNIIPYPANASFEATLTLHYAQQEFNLSDIRDEAGLKLYRNAGDGWKLVGGTADPERNVVTATGITKLSTWAIAHPNDQPLKVEESDGSLPADFELAQNYPNPFLSGTKSRSTKNPETVIEFQLPKASEVEISIFNLQGQKVTTLVRGHQTAGAHKIIWNGTDESGRRVVSGVYLYQLKAGDPSASSPNKSGPARQGFVAARKMLLLR